MRCLRNRHYTCTVRVVRSHCDEGDREVELYWGHRVPRRRRSGPVLLQTPAHSLVQQLAQNARIFFCRAGTSTPAARENESLSDLDLHTMEMVLNKVGTGTRNSLLVKYHILILLKSTHVKASEELRNIVCDYMPSFGSNTFVKLPSCTAAMQLADLFSSTASNGIQNPDSDRKSRDHVCISYNFSRWRMRLPSDISGVPWLVPSNFIFDV